MSDRFVTAFHPEGFKQYGHRLIESFEQYACDFDIHIYASDMSDSRYSGNIASNAVWHEQFDIQELSSFLYRHKDNDHVHGLKPNSSWKQRDLVAGYNYRFDMHKFSRMIYVMWAEAHRDPSGRMVWLDGDCVLREDLPEDFLNRSLPDGYAYSYLGRAKKYSETGFLVFNLPEVFPILDEWASFCTSDSFLKQPEQHSAFLFDRARELYADIKGYNLTPNGSGHPIYDCFVGEYIMHLKGDRKYKGVCPQAEKAAKRYKGKKK